MAVRAGWVVTVARAAAAAWQRVACNPEILPADRVLALLCCAPLQLASFLCLPFLHSHPSFLFPSPPPRPSPRLLLLPPYSPPSDSSSESSSSSDSSSEDDGAAREIDDHHHAD